ncbi:cysteine-rich receptor-like protein kinase 8 [Vigna unguiculata]|uniref:cysteine-rich receptor-like protein kinase 8 n=1 Tax=Vigna unguiculata TaxID=3917 RepID=UPI00101673BE|nr:cysteine-rich receptor-like protein kinase 8 [Vigna unguiculata]
MSIKASHISVFIPLGPAIDDKVPSNVPLTNSGGFGTGWSVVPGHENVPKWCCSYQFDSEKNRFEVDDLGLPIILSLPFESNPIWPMPNLPQRTPQYQHQSSSSVCCLNPFCLLELTDDEKRKQLDWKVRLNIINGIARGLLYLPEDSRLRVIHRDLKASSVLLDHAMNPKISDFGLAKAFEIGQNQANTKRIMGT